VTPESSSSGNGDKPQSDVTAVTEVHAGGDVAIKEQNLSDLASARAVITEQQGTPASTAPLEEEQAAPDQSDENTGEVPDEDMDDTENQTPIELNPISLTLGDAEIDYMSSLAKLVGRSPRAVKRFLNCYRLIKVSLPPEELEAFVDEGESYKFKAVMILLGIITGAPTVSLYVVEEIENWQPDENATMADFSSKLEENADLVKQIDWTRLKTFLDRLTGNDESAEMLAALLEVAPRVSRYSFRVARAEASGPRRAKSNGTSQAKTPRQPMVR